VREMFGAQTEIGITDVVREPEHEFRYVEVVVAFDVAFLVCADEGAGIMSLVLVYWRGGHFESGRGREDGGL
jgi:hypothetical protein